MGRRRSIRERKTPSRDLPKYTIGVAAALTGVPPQMLRRYEQAGLLEPARNKSGKNRLYSDNDVDRTLEISSLAQEGINLAGIRRILAMRQQIRALETQLAGVEAAGPGKQDGAVSSQTENTLTVGSPTGGDGHADEHRGAQRNTGDEAGH